MDDGEEGDDDINEVDMFDVSYAFNLPITCLECIDLTNRLTVMKSSQVFRYVRPSSSTFAIVDKLRLSAKVKFVRYFVR